MKILFIHQNFPGQFLHLAPEMQRRGHQVLGLLDTANSQRAQVIQTVAYKHARTNVDPAGTRLGRTFTEMSDRGVTVARGLASLRDKHDFVPDVIFGHSGWGETMFVREIFPKAKIIIYAEFFYKPHGADVGFDPEFPSNRFEQSLITMSRPAHMAMSMLYADAALSPTRWQASTFPDRLRPMIEVGFDGVDTDVMTPDPGAQVTLPSGQVLKAGDEVLTFINRNLEPYRGYHIFMRALPEVMAARPNAQVVIVGADSVSYGSPPKEGSWKDIFLNEVRDRVDLSRIHFMGKVPYPVFTSLMQISRVHAYLTYPFVLSWSMLEAMSAGAHVVGSRTAPVEELIRDGINGRLVDFFDVPGWSKALVEGLAEPERFLGLRAAARATIVNGYDLRRICLPRIADFVEAVGEGRWKPSDR